jgi:hypothetical protein
MGRNACLRSLLVCVAALGSAPPALGDDARAPAQGAGPDWTEAPVMASGTTKGRSLRERFSEVANVLDFGARGDGRDDSAAVAAAHAFAKATGKTLRFPPGTYVVDQIQLGFGDRVQGSGWLRTVLRPKNPNRSVFLVDRDAKTTTGYAAEIENLKIVGYDTGTGHGIEATDANNGAAMLRIRDVWIENMGGDGVHLAKVWSSLLENVVSGGNRGDQFHIGYSYMCTTFINCYAKRVPTPGRAGYRIVGGRATLLGCNGIDGGGVWGMFGASRAEGDRENGIVRVTLIGNNVEDFEDTGWWFKNGSRFFAEQNHFIAPGRGSVRAVRIRNVTPAIANTWGITNDIESKGAAWVDGRAIHVARAPGILKYGGADPAVSAVWDEGASASVAVPTLGVTPAQSGIVALGGLTITQGEDSGSLIRRHLSASSTWDPPRLVPDAFASTTLVVRGAALGDEVSTSFNQPIPPGALLVGSVTAPDTVSVTLLNKTGAPLDLAPGVVRASAWQH